MSEMTHKDRFLSSLERCSSNEKFIPTFYDRFLGTSEAIRAKFANTDFEKQNQMLLRSLKLAAGATSGDAKSLREIRERAESHNRKNLNIEPRFYDVWLESVIATASECDPVWNDEIGEAWETILGFVIKHMIKYY